MKPPKKEIVFTNDDLKRLKEESSHAFEGTCSIAKMIPALLARLEAAEAYIECPTYTDRPNPQLKRKWEAWRKAAGK